MDAIDSKRQESLIFLCKNIVRKALKKIQAIQKNNINYFLDPNIQREFKTDIDLMLDELILNELKKEKINILSEETGELFFDESNLRFIVDPLDGTVNFIRDLSQCSVSIALYDGLTPIFGVLGIFPSFDIVWGVAKKSAYLNEKKLVFLQLKNFQSL